MLFGFVCGDMATRPLNHCPREQERELLDEMLIWNEDLPDDYSLLALITHEFIIWGNCEGNDPQTTR